MAAGKTLMPRCCASAGHHAWLQQVVPQTTASKRQHAVAGASTSLSKAARCSVTAAGRCLFRFGTAGRNAALP